MAKNFFRIAVFSSFFMLCHILCILSTAQEIKKAPMAWNTTSGPTLAFSNAPASTQVNPADKTTFSSETSEITGKPKNEKEDEDIYEQYRILVDTIDQVDRHYDGEISKRELIEAAIQGVLKKLDPYSSYISSDEMDRFRTSVESRFGGIGIQINRENTNDLVVVNPLPGTPAYHANIFSGDRILEIDGNPTDNISVDDAILLLKGEIGSSVHLKMKRPGQKDFYEVDVVREIIRIETVLGFDRKADDSWNYWLDPKNAVAYIQITTFGQDTAKHLHKTLTDLTNSETGLKGLILDLRFNPGGILPIAIDVCDMFIHSGRIVSVRGRNTKEQFWDAKPDNTLGDFLMVVLINHYSASASEIVAACLQDHSRAVIMGERSWGKGSVQNVMELEDGASALKLTTASYLRPNGKNIHREEGASEELPWGVMPDKGFLIPLSPEQSYRLTLDQKRRSMLKTHSTDSGISPETKKILHAPPYEDPQLLAALTYLEKKLKTGVNATNILRTRLRPATPGVTPAAGRATRR